MATGPQLLGVTALTYYDPPGQPVRRPGACCAGVGYDRKITAMKIVHWLFIVSVMLFVSGIGFVIAGGRAIRAAPAVETTVTANPVATVRQIMNGIVGPAARTVFGAVGTIISVSGTEERAPRTDQEWEEVANNAAALIEAGNLLQMGNRAVDKDDWAKMSQAMTNAGIKALKAAQAKSADDVLAVGEDIYLSCDNCHRRYMRGS
jgi:hypothetical protein